MLDFDTMRYELDEIVQELDMEILRFHRAGAGAKGLRKAIEDRDTFIFQDRESEHEHELARDNGDEDLSFSTNETVSSSSTYYSDCGSSRSFREPGTEVLLSPTQVAEFGWQTSNIRHMSIEVHSTLFGKTVGEMSPQCEAPAIVLCVRLGQYRWYSAKSCFQVKQFDQRLGMVRAAAQLPKAPDLFQSTSPERSESNSRQAEDYFAVLSSSLLRGSDFLLGAVKDFCCTDVIVPSPIFYTSTFVHVKQSIGHKLRFVVFTNSHLNFYDGAGGKLLKSMRLYLSSVQREQGSNTTLRLAEFDRQAVNIKKQVLLSFESENECLKWMAMLQDATYNQGSCTPMLAALPFTISSW